MKRRIVVAWSGGKDAALAYAEIARRGEHQVVALLTTVTEQYGRVSLHGVRVELLRRQAEALGLPLEIVAIPPGADMSQYEARMGGTLERLKAGGAWGVAFGDIFLADVRSRRQEKLAGIGMEAIFPLWGRSTRQLAEEFVAQGFRAILTCVDSQALDGSLAGRAFDASLLAELPPGADPCGENGEFHTFVWAGPIFPAPIGVKRGQVVLRDGRFWFCDLLPTPAAGPE